MESRLNELVIVLLNYMAYHNVPMEELIEYLTGSDDEGKRQLYLLLQFETSCMDDVDVCFLNALNEPFFEEEKEM